MIQAEFFPCDASYKYPVGGVKTNENFTINIKSDASHAFFVLTKVEESPVSYPMEKTSDGFTLTMCVTTKGIYSYYFQLEKANELTHFYAGDDLYASAEEGEEWQLTAYDEVYSTPDTFEGGIIYQIMPDRFAIGKKRYTTKKNAEYRTDWAGTPHYKADEQGIIKNNDMFGGNLDGVIENLDYLKSLGVKCIYLNPIFEASSNHKYDTGSYNRVDGDFGGDEALARLIKKAKSKGIAIMLDGVFSHTGADSIYFNRYGNYDSVGAYQSENSPYFKWYNFEKYPDKYDCWWGVKILPCVNENDTSFTEFITGEDGIVRKYLKMGISGWRLDVADELPDEFLDKLTKAVKKVNPTAMVLGEVWEDASNKVAYSVRRRYLLGGQLDSVTNYPLKDAIIEFVREKDAFALAKTVCTIINNYPKKVVDNLMNMLSTHDTKRILTMLSNDEVPKEKDERAESVISDYEDAVRRLKLASVLQYTLPGTPCLYYGDEAGMQGHEDPFNRRCYPWGREDENLVEFYKVLGSLRKIKALQNGAITIEKSEKGIFIFRRENIRVIANASDDCYPLGESTVDLISGETCVLVEPESAIVTKI